MAFNHFFSYRQVQLLTIMNSFYKFGAQMAEMIQSDSQLCDEDAYSGEDPDDTDLSE